MKIGYNFEGNSAGFYVRNQPLSHFTRAFSLVSSLSDTYNILPEIAFESNRTRYAATQDSTMQQPHIRAHTRSHTFEVHEFPLAMANSDDICCGSIIIDSWTPMAANYPSTCRKIIGEVNNHWLQLDCEYQFPVSEASRIYNSVLHGYDLFATFIG